MTKKIKKGTQLLSLPKNPKDLFQVTMDLSKSDDLVTQRGVQFMHYAAIPSPIGQKERGDYRRTDQYDVITSNGMIYKFVGCFTGAIVSNSKNKKNTSGGIADYSVARLILPRFYDDKTVADGKEIHIAPGDRVFVKDLEVLVVNYQKMQFNPYGVDQAQFPIKSVEHLVDSKNIEYKEGYHFNLKDGHIQWIEGRANPGVDEETGKGRVYSVRYKYNAHWYITDIPNEVRVIQGTEGNERKVQRMSYSAVIQREYVYYNQNHNPESTDNRQKEKRQNKPVQQKIETIDNYKIKVDMNDIE